MTACRTLDLLHAVDFSLVMVIRRISYTVLAAALVACTSTPDDDPSATDRAISNVESGAEKAVTAPLDDLNLRRDKIPEQLKAIKTPYSRNAGISCEAIAAEVESLNALLGRDWDVPPPEKDKFENRAADGASTALLDALASGTSGLIPYRGFVRSLSGANRHRKKVLSAYERGSHRRTFLKGVGLANGCEGAAAPAPLPEQEPKVVFRQ